jgi:hypothetical protein
LLRACDQPPRRHRYLFVFLSLRVYPAFVSPGLCERVRAGVHAEREGAGHQEIKAAAPFRRGGHAAVQTDGLLLQGGALVRREGRHDLLRQAEDSRAGQQLQPQGRHTQTGTYYLIFTQGVMSRFYEGGNRWVLEKI